MSANGCSTNECLSHLSRPPAGNSSYTVDTLTSILTKPGTVSYPAVMVYRLCNDFAPQNFSPANFVLDGGKEKRAAAADKRKAIRNRQ